jgi:long-chain fatty acid transport protein
MNRRETFKLLAAAVLGGVPWTVLANGMRLASQDAFASARGEAFVATADNPSAIYYNPAGIAQLDGNNFRAGLYEIYLDPSYKPPSSAANSGQTYYDQKNFATVPQFFYTYTPEELPVSFGVGIYSPYGLGVSWPQDTGFRSVATRGSLTYLTANPVVALKLAPNFSIAGGVTVNYANTDLEQGLRRNEIPSLPDYFHFRGDGWSVGYNLGVLWQPHEMISIGASLRSSSTVTLKGHTDFARPAQIPPTQEEAQTDFSFPLNAVFGISYRPTPKWNLEFDADYTDWSSFETITIQQAATRYPLQKDISLALDWEPSWMFEFGATRYFDNGWHVSAGYVYNENSVPDANYTPLAADLDRHFFSVGTGVKVKRFDIDLAYQFGYGPARTVAGSSPSTAGRISGQTADGTYDFISNAILLTVGMHF